MSTILPGDAGPPDARPEPNTTPVRIMRLRDLAKRRGFITGAPWGYVRALAREEAARIANGDPIDSVTAALR